MGAVRLNPSIKTEDVSVTATLTAGTPNGVLFAPKECGQSNCLGYQLFAAWPTTTWDGAIVTPVSHDGQYGVYYRFGELWLTTAKTQGYYLTARFYYLG